MASLNKVKKAVNKRAETMLRFESSMYTNVYGSLVICAAMLQNVGAEKIKMINPTSVVVSVAVASVASVLLATSVFSVAVASVDSVLLVTSVVVSVAGASAAAITQAAL